MGILKWRSLFRAADRHEDLSEDGCTVWKLFILCLCSAQWTLELRSVSKKRTSFQIINPPKDEM